MRVWHAAAIDICDGRDYDSECLGEMQEADGSWPMGWTYKYPLKNILIENKGLTTAIPIRNYKELELRLYSGDPYAHQSLVLWNESNLQVPLHHDARVGTKYNHTLSTIHTRLFFPHGMEHCK